MPAQTDSLLPAYRTVEAKQYLIADGLPDQCVADAFIDYEGRLTLIPCVYAQSVFQLGPYHFDGFHAYPASPVVREGVQNMAFVTTAVKENAILCGYIYRLDEEENKASSAYFILDMKTGKITVDSLFDQEGKRVVIRNVIPSKEGYYILGGTDDAYQIFHLSKGKTTRIQQLAKYVELGLARDPWPFVESATAIWFAGRQDTLYEISKQDNAIRKYAIGFDLAYSDYVHDKLLCTRGDEILYGPPGTENVYRVSRQNSALEACRMPGISGDRYESLYCYQDNVGNLLYVAVLPERGFIARLVDVHGDVYRYDDIVQRFPEDLNRGLRFSNIVGEDFKKGCMLTGTHCVVFEVALQDLVQAYPSLGVRGFVPLSDQELLVVHRGILDLAGDQNLRQDRIPACFLDVVPETDIVSDKGGVFWFCKKGGLVSGYDPQKGICKNFLVGGQLDRLALIDETTLLVSDRNGQLSFLNTQNGFLQTPLQFSIPGHINQLYPGRHQIVWVATSEGLVSIDFDRDTILQHHLPALSAVQCIYEDEGGRLWSGTFGAGLKIYDPKTGSTRTLHENEGLSNNTVVTILEDDQGAVWLGTFNGITVISKDLELIGHVYKRDGLIDSECNRWSAAKLADGRLCFGTPKGFSIIDPLKVKEQMLSRQRPQIYLNRVAYGDTTEIIGKMDVHAALEHGITLPAHNRNLKLSYGLSKYVAPDESRYAYLLEGISTGWNAVGSLRDLTLIDLPAGRYHILVKGADYRGVWSQNILKIPVHVGQYFYLQWWFYVLCALPVIGFALLWAYRQKAEQKRLAFEVARRTETIREQTEELKELDKVKTRLYTNITHEFRTPLTVIQGLADRIKTEDLHSGEMIKRNASSLLNLVNQMLDLRKLESGKLELGMVRSDVIRYLSYLCESMRSLAEQRGHQFHFLCTSDAFVMDFDPEKLARILTNLITNAIKFTPEGGDIYIQVITPEAHGQTVSIQVTDTGIGIPPDQVDRVFDRFYQVDDSTTRRGEGTGIGLTLVRELVRLMEGTIQVKSRQGQGTTFTVELPVRHEAPLRDPEAISEPLISTPPVLPHETPGFTELETDDQHVFSHVLIVEDNPDVVHYIGTCLEDQYRLSIALDGQEGIEKAIEKVPDLIVSDVMMPGKSGFALCKILKEDVRTSHIPIILLTARADAESRLVGLKRGADAYLSKPFNEQELRIRIESLIASRQTLRERYAEPEMFAQKNPSGTPSPEPELELEDAFIIRFREILLDNISNENFGVAEMVRAMHVSRTQLHNKVKALTGNSASKYMRTLRLHEATRHLSEGKLQISEVAFAVGYKDPKYFTRVFKETYGVTPSDWMRV